jgi:CubicO group peptidase (beta-lactamase class C family)
MHTRDSSCQVAGHVLLQYITRVAAIFYRSIEGRTVMTISRWAFEILRLALLVFVVEIGVVQADAPPAQGLPSGDPAAVGMDADVLAGISPAMQKFVDDRQIAGAVTLIARRGQIVHLGAVGLADIAQGTPMTADSLFVIASMTKPITATAVLILQDDGKLSVDDPVIKYLPEFADAKLNDKPPARPITIRDVMTHTAGLAGEQRTERSLEETVSAIIRRPLAFEPGTKWQYSPGLNICGRNIEKVSGQPFDEFLTARIFRPLAMSDTTFRPSEEQRKRLARIYKTDAAGALEPASHWLADDWQDRAPNPSGGLYSTAANMARFYQMVLNGGELAGTRIISREAVAQMTSVQTGELRTGFTDGNGWGLGWCVVRQPQGITAMLSPGTYGHGGAFGTQGWVDPQRQMIFVLMIQRVGLPNSDGSDLRRTLQELAVRAVRDP